MFSADLTWNEIGTETVGARRARKEQERSSTASSIQGATSPRSSTTADPELSWTSGPKKSKGFRLGNRRPSSKRSYKSQPSNHQTAQPPEHKPSHDARDLTPQQPWTSTSTLSLALPLKAPFHAPVHEVIELEGDTASRLTAPTWARLSQPPRWEQMIPYPVEDEKRASPQQLEDNSHYSSNVTIPISTFSNREGFGTMSRSTDMEQWEFMQKYAVDGATLVEETKHTSFETTRSDRRTMECRPLSQWESLTPRGIPQEMQSAPEPRVDEVALVQRRRSTPTRFQRFIERMESAGPQAVLDRLMDGWEDLPGEEIDDELALEKQLWLLTGFHMQNLGKIREAPKPLCTTGRILELYGNLSEVFQSSAMCPDETVYFLTTRPQRSITLPTNVSYLTVREYGSVPLPYPVEYFSHIRSSTLPSLVPSYKLPELLSELFNLLAPGGLLEIRVIDAAPVRNTTGPLLQTWIEERLSVNLERLFRCSKPCSLMSNWLADAGFSPTTPSDGSNVTLPCAVDPSLSDVDNELSAVIGKALWKDIWGAFITEIPGEPKWWWNDRAIMQECLERQTVLECRTVFAYKH